MDDTWAPMWVWLGLFPLTYLIHFAEEMWGGEGYPAYLYRLRGVRLSTRRFVVLQGIGLVLMLAGIAASLRFGFPQLMTAILAALVLSNGITHTITALLHRGYGPGLLTSVLAWIPLGAATLIAMFTQISLRRWLLAAAIGFAINATVALLALRGGRVTRQEVADPPA